MKKLIREFLTKNLKKFGDDQLLFDGLKQMLHSYTEETVLERRITKGD